jgi:hypothetical protein
MKFFSNPINPNTAGGAFINEIHYDNAGGDVGEFIEICIPAGTDVTGFELVLYNGANGETYDTEVLTQPDPAVCPAATDGNTYLEVPISGIQNGAPDGMALVDDMGVVCQFLSYEGTITATNGPANGLTSTDIGAAETGSTLVGTSIQLQPNGTWIAGLTETPKDINICFLEGTNILTKEGSQSIETLKVGDLVRTASGKELPIKWVGIQTVDINNKDRNLLLSNPVVIKQGALLEGIPSKDLKVSPNHAIYVEGLLINAGALVNGVNIYQEVPTESFKYYHIELDSHELVIAENTPSESYLPQNENRDDFDNAAAFDAMYPNGRKLILWPLDYPRISAQTKVPEYINSHILRDASIKKIA